MSHKPERQFPDGLSQIYSRLNQLDVEQFYSGYQWWITHRRINALQEEIDTLRLQIDENAEYMQHVRPPAVALATLARLQANGVDDLDLLDSMLEQGEEWLDLIMQRLDYCEQLNFLHDNYTQWCEHALEGAYDWIDSIRDAGVDASPPLEAASDIAATEELLLRKLTSEEEGEISSGEDIQEQVAEIAELEATLATEAEDAVDLLASSMMQESEQQPMELAPVPEVQVNEPLETISSAEVDIDLASVPIEQDDTQQLEEPVETPEAAVPNEIDAAAVEELLSTEIDEQDTTSETHSEEKEAEAAAGSEVLLPDEVNVDGEEPAAEKLSSAAVESVEESPVVTDAPEESTPGERVSQVDAEHAPVQDQTPKRRRSFWEFLLGLPGH